MLINFPMLRYTVTCSGKKVAFTLFGDDLSPLLAGSSRAKKWCLALK